MMKVLKRHERKRVPHIDRHTTERERGGGGEKDRGERDRQRETDRDGWRVKLAENIVVGYGYSYISVSL